MEVTVPGPTTATVSWGITAEELLLPIAALLLDGPVSLEELPSSDDETGGIDVEDVPLDELEDDDTAATLEEPLMLLEEPACDDACLLLEPRDGAPPDDEDAGARELWTHAPCTHT